MRSIRPFGKNVLMRRWVLCCVAALLLACTPMRAGQQAEGERWLLGKAHHIPSEFTNQESGYFSIEIGRAHV